MHKDDRRDNRRGQGRKEAPEFEQKIIDLARVTRVMAGGKRMKFRACVAIGDKKGSIGFGLAKGADVTLAVNKAVNRAKKVMIRIPMINETIPHAVYVKYKAAKVFLKPAHKGTGLKTGGAVRMVLELSGLPNVVGKIHGANNKVNNVKALFKAIESLKPVVLKEKKENKKPEVRADEIINATENKKQPVKTKQSQIKE